jgi:hypothetical protein
MAFAADSRRWSVAASVAHRASLQAPHTGVDSGGPAPFFGVSFSRGTRSASRLTDSINRDQR